jgi:hypothetical protein
MPVTHTEIDATFARVAEGRYAVHAGAHGVVLESFEGPEPVVPWGQPVEWRRS